MNATQLSYDMYVNSDIGKQIIVTETSTDFGLRPWVTSFLGLMHEAHVGVSDPLAGFMVGPLIEQTVAYSCVTVIEVTALANNIDCPAKERVHKALKTLNFTHMIYPTDHNGTYIVILPAVCRTEQEMFYHATHFTGLLREIMDVVLPFSSKKSTWSRVWKLPGTSATDKLPENLLWHVGFEVNPKALVQVTF